MSGGRAADHVSPVRSFAAFDMEAARRYEAWYGTHAGRRAATTEETLLADMLSVLTPVRSALEVGSGTGHFTRWFAGMGLQVIGLDDSPAMLAVACELDGAPEYIVGAAEKLPFSDASFDLAAFVTSLEFVGNPVLALQEGSRVVRRGLLLGVLNSASLLGISRNAKARFHPSLYRDAHLYNPWELARLIRLALGSRAKSVIWRTTLWPRWMPRLARRLPCGGFIGVMVILTPVVDAASNAANRGHA